MATDGPFAGNGRFAEGLAFAFPFFFFYFYGGKLEDDALLNANVLTATPSSFVYIGNGSD